MNQPSILARVLTAMGPFLALLALMIVLRVDIGARFWSGDNIRIILTQTVVVAIAASGMTMIIVSGGIDLSVGSVMALCGVLAAMTLHAGYGPMTAVLVAIAAGVVSGAFNGAIIAGFGMAPFIVTLGMLGMARGLAKRVADDQSVDIIPAHAPGAVMADGGHTWIDTLMKPIQYPFEPLTYFAKVFAPGVWIAVGVSIALAVVMGFTVFGRHCYAIGSNEAGARLCGIRVRSTKFLIYVISGALVGLAGLLEMSKLHQGDPTTAVGRELDVIAAVVIGGASLSGGTGTILGTVIGALIMGVLRNGSQQMNWSTSTQEILIGAVIIIAVGIDKLRHRKPG